MRLVNRIDMDRLDYRCRITSHLQNDLVKGGSAVHLDP